MRDTGWSVSTAADNNHGRGGTPNLFDQRSWCGVRIRCEVSQLEMARNCGRTAPDRAAWKVDGDCRRWRSPLGSVQQLSSRAPLPRKPSRHRPGRRHCLPPVVLDFSVEAAYASLAIVAGCLAPPDSTYLPTPSAPHSRHGPSHPVWPRTLARGAVQPTRSEHIRIQERSGISLSRGCAALARIGAFP